MRNKQNIGFFLAISMAAFAFGANERATSLRPDVVPPLVNAAILYSQAGRYAEAEKALRRAVEAEPDDPAANFNLGLLRVEKGDRESAERLLRRAVKTDTRNAAAAFNLGVLLADHDRAACLELCRKAWTLAPEEPKYGYTLGFYLHRAGQENQSIAVLEEGLKRAPEYAQFYLLLGKIYEAGKNYDKARAEYERAAAEARLPAELRAEFAEKAAPLRKRESGQAPRPESGGEFGQNKPGGMH